MEKKSKKSKDTNDKEEHIVVNIDGKKFIEIPALRITNCIDEFTKRVQTVNFCNENPNVPVNEAITRFEKLSAPQRSEYGIRPKDSLEAVVRVMNDVCGKEYFPPLVKHDLQSHFTVQDFITGRIDVLTFVETFTNGVAEHMKSTMAEELTKVTSLFREEGGDPNYVWKPHEIVPHAEDYVYEPTNIDTGVVSEDIRKVLGQSDYSRATDQQRRAKYSAFTSKQASTAFWNGFLPGSTISQTAVNYYLLHTHGLKIDDDAQTLPVYDVNGNKLVSTHRLSSSEVLGENNWRNMRIVSDDLCVLGKFLTREPVKARAGDENIKMKKIAMESPSLYTLKSMGDEPIDLPEHEIGIKSLGLNPMCHISVGRRSLDTHLFGDVHKLPRDPLSGSIPEQAKTNDSIFPLPMSLPPLEVCTAKSAHQWMMFEIGNPELAKYITDAIDSTGVTQFKKAEYDKLQQYISEEREKISKWGFNSQRETLVNGGTNHANGSMISVLELASAHYRRDYVDVEPGQPITPAWEAMQPLAKIAVQLYVMIDNIIVKRFLNVFDNNTRKDISLQMEKISGNKVYNCFNGIESRPTVPTIQEVMGKSMVYDMGNKSHKLQRGKNLVDPSGALSPDIFSALRFTNACTSIPPDETLKHTGATFNVRTERFDAESGAWLLATYPTQQFMSRQMQTACTMTWNYNISTAVTGMHGKPIKMCNGITHKGKWITPGNCDTVNEDAKLFAAQHRRPVPGTDPPSAPGGATHMYHLVFQILHNDPYSMGPQWISYMNKNLLPKIADVDEDEVFIQWLRALDASIRTRRESEAFSGASDLTEDDIRVLLLNLLDKILNNSKHYSVQAINLAAEFRKQLTKLPKEKKATDLIMETIDEMKNEKRLIINSSQPTFELPNRLKENLASNQDKAKLNGVDDRKNGINAMYGGEPTYRRQFRHITSGSGKGGSRFRPSGYNNRPPSSSSYSNRPPFSNRFRRQERPWLPKEEYLKTKNREQRMLALGDISGYPNSSIVQQRKGARDAFKNGQQPLAQKGQQSLNLIGRRSTRGQRFNTNKGKKTRKTSRTNYTRNRGVGSSRRGRGGRAGRGRHVRKNTRGGRGSGSINVTVEVPDEFSPISSIGDYTTDIGRKPYTARQSAGNSGDAYMYFVDSAGQVLCEEVALEVARSVHKAKSKGKSVPEKYIEAAQTVLSGLGMYSEKQDEILEEDSQDSEDGYESNASDTIYSDSDDDDESIEVTYWADPETKIMYEVLYDHERDQYYVENDIGVRVYLDDEGDIDAETTDEVESMQASIHTLTDDHYQSVVSHSSPFVVLTENKRNYKDRYFGGLNTINFDPEKMVLEENHEAETVTNTTVVDQAYRSEQQVEALTRLEGRSPDVMPFFDAYWVTRLSMDGIDVCSENDVIMVKRDEGEACPIELSYGHFTRLALMHRSSDDKVSQMVQKSYIDNLNACAMYCWMTENQHHYDCMIYMLAYHRKLDEIEQIIRSNMIQGVELHEYVLTILKASYAVYDTSENSEEVNEPRLLAAHAFVRLCDAHDCQLYPQQDAVEWNASNYRQAKEILHKATLHPDVHSDVSPAQPVNESSSDLTDDSDEDGDDKILSLITEVTSLPTPPLTGMMPMMGLVIESATSKILTKGLNVEPKAGPDEGLDEKLPMSATEASKIDTQSPMEKERKKVRKNKKKKKKNAKNQKKETNEENQKVIGNDEAQEVERAISDGSRGSHIPAESDELRDTFTHYRTCLQQINELQKGWTETAPTRSLSTASRALKLNKARWAEMKDTLEKFRHEPAYQSAVTRGLCIKERKDLSKLKHEIDIAMRETAPQIIKKLIKESLTSSVDEVTEAQEIGDSSLVDASPPPLEPIPRSESTPYRYSDHGPPPLEPIRHTELTDNELKIRLSSRKVPHTCPDDVPPMPEPVQSTEPHRLTETKPNGLNGSATGHEESEMPGVDHFARVVESLKVLADSLDEAHEQKLAVMMRSANQINLSKLSTKCYVVKRLQTILEDESKDESDWKQAVERNPTIPLENLAYVYLHNSLAYLLIRVANNDDFNKSLVDSFKKFPKFVGLGFRGEPDWYDNLPDNYVSFSKNRTAAKKFGKCVMEQRFRETDGAFDLSSVGNPQVGEEGIIFLPGYHDEENLCEGIRQEKPKTLYDFDWWSRVEESLTPSPEPEVRYTTQGFNKLSDDTDDAIDGTQLYTKTDRWLENVSEDLENDEEELPPLEPIPSAILAPGDEPGEPTESFDSSIEKYEILNSLFGDENIVREVFNFEGAPRSFDIKQGFINSSRLMVQLCEAALNLMGTTQDVGEAELDEVEDVVVNVSQPVIDGITVTSEAVKSTLLTYKKVVDNAIDSVKGKLQLVSQLTTHLREPWPSMKIMRYLKWIPTDAVVYPMGDMALSEDLFNRELWAFNVQDSFGQKHDKLLMKSLSRNAMALIDSGASKTAVRNVRGMNNIKRVANGFISAANGQHMTITHIGSIVLGVWNIAGLEDELKLYSVLVVPEVQHNIISTGEMQKTSVSDEPDRVYHDTLLRMRKPVLRRVDQNGIRLNTYLDIPIINGAHSWLPIRCTRDDVGGIMQLGSADTADVRLLSKTHPTAFRSMMWNPEGELFGAINVLVSYTNVCMKDDVIYMNQTPTKSNYITHESMGKLFDEQDNVDTRTVEEKKGQSEEVRKSGNVKKASINAIFSARGVKVSYMQAHQGLDHALTRRGINQAIECGHIEGFYISDNKFDDRGRLTNTEAEDRCEACERMTLVQQQTFNEKRKATLGVVNDGEKIGKGKGKLGSNQYSVKPGMVNADPSKRSVEWREPLSTWLVDIAGPVSTSEIHGQNFLCIGREDGAIFVVFCVEQTTEGRPTIRVFPIQRKNQVLSALMELTTWVLQMGRITTEFIMDSDRTQKAAVKVIKLAFPFLTVTLAAPNTVTENHSMMAPLDAQVAYVFRLVNATLYAKRLLPSEWSTVIRDVVNVLYLIPSNTGKPPAAQRLHPGTPAQVGQLVAAPLGSDVLFLETKLNNMTIRHGGSMGTLVGRGANGDLAVLAAGSMRRLILSRGRIFPNCPFTQRHGNLSGAMMYSPYIVSYENNGEMYNSQNIPWMDHEQTTINWKKGAEHWKHSADAIAAWVVETEKLARVMKGIRRGDVEYKEPELQDGENIVSLRPESLNLPRIRELHRLLAKSKKARETAEKIGKFSGNKLGEPVQVTRLKALLEGKDVPGDAITVDKERLLDAIHHETMERKDYNPCILTRTSVPLPDAEIRGLETRMQNTYHGQYSEKWRKLPGCTLITVTKGKSPGTAAYSRFQKYRTCSTIPDMIKAGAKVTDIDEGLRNGTLQIQIERKVVTDDPTYKEPIERHLKDYIKANASRERRNSKNTKDLLEQLDNDEHDDILGDLSSSDSDCFDFSERGKQKDDPKAQKQGKGSLRDQDQEPQEGDDDSEDTFIFDYGSEKGTAESEDDESEGEDNLLEWNRDGKDNPMSWMEDLTDNEEPNPQEASVRRANHLKEDGKPKTDKQPKQPARRSSRIAEIDRLKRHDQRMAARADELNKQRGKETINLLEDSLLDEVSSEDAASSEDGDSQDGDNHEDQQENGSRDGRESRTIDLIGRSTRLEQVSAVLDKKQKEKVKVAAKKANNKVEAKVLATISSDTELQSLAKKKTAEEIQKEENVLNQMFLTGEVDGESGESGDSDRFSFTESDCDIGENSESTDDADGEYPCEIGIGVRGSTVSTTTTTVEDATPEEAIGSQDDPMVKGGVNAVSDRVEGTVETQMSEGKTNKATRVLFMIIHGDKVLTTRPKSDKEPSQLPTTTIKLGHHDNWKSQLLTRVSDMFGIDVPDENMISLKDCEKANDGMLSILIDAYGCSGAKEGKKAHLLQRMIDLRNGKPERGNKKFRMLDADSMGYMINMMNSEAFVNHIEFMNRNLGVFEIMDKNGYRDVIMAIKASILWDSKTDEEDEEFDPRQLKINGGHIKLTPKDANNVLPRESDGQWDMQEKHCNQMPLGKNIDGKKCFPEGCVPIPRTIEEYLTWRRTNPCAYAIWKPAADRERQGYIKISKSTVVPEDEIPEDQRKNMITARAIFTMKPIVDPDTGRNMYHPKVRYVTQGFKQIAGVHFFEVFAATPSKDTIKIFWALVAILMGKMKLRNKPMYVMSFDIRQAFMGAPRLGGGLQYVPVMPQSLDELYGRVRRLYAANPHAAYGDRNGSRALEAALLDIILRQLKGWNNHYYDRVMFFNDDFRHLYNELDADDDEEVDGDIALFVKLTDDCYGCTTNPEIFAELVCKLNERMYETRLTDVKRMNGFNIHLSEIEDSTGDIMPVIEMYPEELLNKVIGDNKFILDYDIRASTILPWPKYEKKCEDILGQPLPTREIEQRILRVCSGDQRQVFKYWYEREPNTWKFDSILMFGVTSKACLKGALATQDTFRSLIGAIGFSATTVPHIIQSLKDSAKRTMKATVWDLQVLVHMTKLTFIMRAHGLKFARELTRLVGGNQYGAFPTVFADSAFTKPNTAEEKAKMIEEDAAKKLKAKECNVALSVGSVDNPPNARTYELYLDSQTQLKNTSIQVGFGNTAMVVYMGGPIIHRTLDTRPRNSHAAELSTMTTAAEHGELINEYVKGFGQPIYQFIGGDIAADSMTSDRNVSVRVHSDNSSSITIANNPSSSKAKEKEQVALAQANGMHHDKGCTNYLHVTRDNMPADVMSRVRADNMQQTGVGYWIKVAEITCNDAFLIRNVTNTVEAYYAQQENYGSYEIIPTNKPRSMEFPPLPKATKERIEVAHNECKAKNDGDGNTSKAQVEGHPEMKDGGHQQHEQQQTGQANENKEVRFDEQDSVIGHANEQANEVRWEVRKSKKSKAQQKVQGKEPNRDGEDTKVEQAPKSKQKPKIWKK